MFTFNIGQKVRVKNDAGAYAGVSGVVIAQFTRGLTSPALYYKVNLDPYGEAEYGQDELELLAPLPQETQEALPAPDPMRQPASDTATKLLRWLELETEVNRLKERLQKAQVELDGAVRDLGAHLCPPNAKVDEYFHIWVGDSMVRTKLLDSPGDKRYIVVPYYKGKNWGRW